MMFIIVLVPTILVVEDGRVENIELICFVFYLIVKAKFIFDVIKKE